MRTQIVSRAILMKTNQRIEEQYVIDKEDISKVLGCYILNIDLTYELTSNFKVNVIGSYDINLWLLNAEENSTYCKVEKRMIDYKTKFDDIESLGNESIGITFIEKPNCKNASYEKDKVKLDITYILCIELIGDRKFYIEVADDAVDELVDKNVNIEYLPKDN